MASQATDYAEIQQDEIEALRSIYMEAFEEEKAKVGAWNVSPVPIDFMHWYTLSTDAQYEHQDYFLYFIRDSLFASYFGHSIQRPD